MVSTITLVGIGKLGAPMAACMAAQGFRVKAVDLESQKVNCINRKMAPVYEPGLEELLLKSGALLEGTQDTAEAVRNSEATFVVVGTPSEEGGGFSLRNVLPTCEAIGKGLAG